MLLAVDGVSTLPTLVENEMAGGIDMAVTYGQGWPLNTSGRLNPYWAYGDFFTGYLFPAWSPYAWYGAIPFYEAAPGFPPPAYSPRFNPGACPLPSCWA